MLLTLTNICTGLSKVSWKYFLNIPAKQLSASKTIVFGSPNLTKKFPKAHHVNCYDVISFSPLYAHRPNSVIKSRHVRILRDPYQYGMSHFSKNYMNTTSHGVSDSITWSVWWALWEHEFTYFWCMQDLMNWTTSLLTICQKTVPVYWISLYSYVCVLLLYIHSMMKSPLVWTWRGSLSALVS